MRSSNVSEKNPLMKLRMVPFYGSILFSYIKVEVGNVNQDAKRTVAEG
jgi:hypothetical protein